jgi:hypothetical protein
VREPTLGERRESRLDTAATCPAVERMGDGRGYADHGWNRTADSGLADSGLGALLMHHQPVTRSPGPASARVARRSALCIGSGGPIPPRPLGAQGRRRLAGTAASRPAASVYAGTGSVRWPGGRRSRPCQIVNGVPSLPAGVRFAESCPPSPLRQPTMQGQEWGTQFSHGTEPYRRCGVARGEATAGRSDQTSRPWQSTFLL